MPHPRPRFTNRFLVVTPASRSATAALLLPSDDQNYYRMRTWCRRLLVSCTRPGEHHQLPHLPARDRPEIKGVASRTRQILTRARHRPVQGDDDTSCLGSCDLGSYGAHRAEADGAQRRGHHCYQDKPIEAPPTRNARSTVRRRTQRRARCVQGLQAINRRVASSIYDLSPRPSTSAVRLREASSSRGRSDFSLMDAIESGS